MGKYKVYYSGFAYVYADDPKDAEENFDRDCALFDEYQVDGVQEVDDFTVEV